MIASGTRRGPYLLVTKEDGTVVLLRQTHRNPESFGKDFLKQATARVAALKNPEKEDATENFTDKRMKEWRNEFSHWDFADLRPEFVGRRIVYGITLFSAYAYTVHSWYKDEPPSIITPIMATALYPLALYIVSSLAAHYSPPERYVFELLLAFDVYQLFSSVFVFVAIIMEAYNLGMYPMGNSQAVSSVWLRALVWFHYHNRIIELLDTLLRISHRRMGAYGAMHFYMRMVNLWSWYAAAGVAGGDVYFITACDSFVLIVRFLVFSLSLLRWSLNFVVDFGMHAPKRRLFRKEHLYHLQIAEFATLFIHALLALYWGNMPQSLMIVQIVVMFQFLLIFTNFSYSRDAEDICRYQDARLMFSFDSSAWFFLYHFGVAMWLEDNIDLEPSAIGYSGSSGGALVAGSLSCGINNEELSSWVIEHSYPVAHLNPFKLLPQCEKALDIFLPRDAHVPCSDVLRVLLTKVSRRPPFVMGEVVSQYYSWNHLFAVLRASCHIPLVCILPYPIPGLGWYYDGLLWASLFVPWRTFSESDNLIRVSAFGMPWADIKCSVSIPFWWAMFPPSVDGLYGLIALGYHDAQEYYNTSEQPQADRLRALAKKRPRPSRLDAERLAQIERLQESAAVLWRRGVLAMIAMTLMFYHWLLF